MITSDGRVDGKNESQRCCEFTIPLARHYAVATTVGAAPRGSGPHMVAHRRVVMRACTLEIMSMWRTLVAQPVQLLAKDATWTWARWCTRPHITSPLACRHMRGVAK